MRKRCSTVLIYDKRCRSEPVRNVAILDALIIGLCVLAITPLVSLYTLDVRSLYPAYLIWGRAVGRSVLAALLFYLKPREGAVTRPS